MTNTPSGWSRFAGFLLIAVSAIPAVVCYYLLAVMVPADVRRYQEYTAAEPCPTRAAEKRTEECLRTVTFTVERTVVRDAGKNSEYRAVLRGTPFWNGSLAFGDSGPLLRGLRPNDRVTGTVWRGDVMRLEREGVRQSSSDEPRDEPQFSAGIGAFAGLLAALGLYVGTARLAGGTGRTAPTWRSFGRPFLITAAVACLVTTVLTFWLALPWWLVPAVAVPGSALAARLFHLHARTAAPDRLGLPVG